MLAAPHATATPGPTTTIAAPRAATPVAAWTEPAKRTRSLPGRRPTPRQRQVSGSRIGGQIGGTTAVVLRRQMINAINAGTHRLDAGNELLAALNQKPLKGDRQVTFRVQASVRTPYDGLARMIGHAQTLIADELDQLRWTRLAGCPEGYGIDEPTVSGRYGALYGIVHTTLRLTVTVLAYQDHELDATASRLLRTDLGRLRRVRPALTDITLWDREVTSWDEYLVDADPEDVSWPLVLG